MATQNTTALQLEFGNLWGSWNVSTNYSNSTTPDTARKKYNWPALCLFSIVLVTIMGNIMVCLAVKLERKLHNMFNYFLVSLACSDMLSATLIMPLSITRTFLDDLPVPLLLCVAWYSLDVFFTSSTIIHLCMISVDRYMSLKYPLKYGHAKKTRHTVMKICIVWVLSFCIAGPLFLLSMFDKERHVSDYKGCGPETPMFVITATVVSFYLPLGIMIVMYILTVKALHSQLQSQKKLALVKSWSNSSDRGSKKRKTYHTASQRKMYDSESETGFTSMEDRPSRSEERKLLSVSHSHTNNAPSTMCKSAPGSPRMFHSNGSGGTYANRLTVSSSSKDLTIENVAGRNQMARTSLTPDSPSTERNGKWKDSNLHRNVSTQSTPHYNKARRAVLVLGILFAVFLVFYLPFFITYVIHGTCKECRKYISPRTVMAFEWLAYSGSSINPIIYHIFNPDFQRAFKKLFTCDYSRF